MINKFNCTIKQKYQHIYKSLVILVKLYCLCQGKTTIEKRQQIIDIINISFHKKNNISFTQDY
jgi:hypothetical protein